MAIGECHINTKCNLYTKNDQNRRQKNSTDFGSFSFDFQNIQKIGNSIIF